MEIEIEKFYPFMLKMKNATLLGYADVRLGGVLKIRGIKLIRKPNGGTFIVPPSVQTPRGDFVDLVEFTDRKLREKIRKALSDYYKTHYGNGIT
jgi:DNA-binding cell septation regulator SpoVG